MRAAFLGIVAAVGSLSSCLAGQDILHYKFESGSGGIEVNYGDPAPGVPRIATIVPQGSLTTAQAWATGRFGSALAAGPINGNSGYELDTGWDGTIGTNVDVTLACFFKIINPIASNDFANLCGPPGNGQWVKLSMSGQTGFLQVDWNGGGSPHSLTLSQDLMTAAFANWVHVAVVVDRSGTASCGSATVQWFVNGVPQIPQVGSGCWNDVSGSSLQTYRFGRKDDAHFAFDDWRLCLRAVPAAEIMQWATSDLAGDAPFGDACHPFGVPVLLWGSGGNPSPGNAAYKLTVYGLPGSGVFLGIGLSDTTISGVPLPIDLGAIIPTLGGCFLRTSAESLLTGTIGATGGLDFPIGIPSIPGLVGVDAYAQAVLYSSVLGAWSSTNAWAAHVGN